MIKATPEMARAFSRAFYGRDDHEPTNREIERCLDAALNVAPAGENGEAIARRFVTEARHMMDGNEARGRWLYSDRELATRLLATIAALPSTVPVAREALVEAEKPVVTYYEANLMADALSGWHHHEGYIAIPPDDYEEAFRMVVEAYWFARGWSPIKSALAATDNPHD